MPLAVAFAAWMGFVRFRYQHGWGHESNPEDPLEVYRYTNRVAGATRLLAKVPKRALYGSFAKTHLMSFLQALKCGTVAWNDDDTLMTPPEGQVELADHLERGMFYEVFSYDSIKCEAAAVRSLIASDNFDAGFALGQTELQLLKCIGDAMKVVRPPVGRTQFDVIREAVTRAAGQRWADDDIVALYIFPRSWDSLMWSSFWT